MLVALGLNLSVISINNQKVMTDQTNVNMRIKLENFGELACDNIGLCLPKFKKLTPFRILGKWYLFASLKRDQPETRLEQSYFWIKHNVTPYKTVSQ